MSILALAAVFVVVFATSRWSGRTLARHHGDGLEVAAVAALGVATLGALWVIKVLHGDADALPTLGLAGAGAGGLLAGYMRADSVA